MAKTGGRMSGGKNVLLSRKDVRTLATELYSVDRNSDEHLFQMQFQLNRKTTDAAWTTSTFAIDSLFAASLLLLIYLKKYIFVAVLS